MDRQNKNQILKTKPKNFSQHLYATPCILNRSTTLTRSIPKRTDLPPLLSQAKNLFLILFLVISVVDFFISLCCKKMSKKFHFIFFVWFSNGIHLFPIDYPFEIWLRLTHLYRYFRYQSQSNKLFQIKIVFITIYQVSQQPELQSPTESINLTFAYEIWTLSNVSFWQINRFANTLQFFIYSKKQQQQQLIGPFYVDEIYDLCQGLYRCFWASFFYDFFL